MTTSYGSAGHKAGDDPRPLSDRKHDPQSTAWIVLWIAFGLFLVLVIGASLGGKRYYDTATVPTGATLSIDSGIVLFRDAVTSTLINASSGLDLREGDDVLVGQGARARITLFDGSKVDLYSGSEISLNELRQARFHDGFSRVTLRLTKGTARVQVSEPPTQTRRFALATPHGFALLSEGNFGVDVSNTQARVSSRLGSASVSAKDATVKLASGEKAVLAPEGLAGPLPEGDLLVKNGDFSQGFSQWGPLDFNEPGRPEEPGQRSLTAEKVAGQDTMALHIQRLSPRGTHNETGLTQPINKDVSDYHSLSLKANIKVTGQSLSGGGYLGYEYPLMIRVRYRDATGGQIDWTHGFFVTNPEERPTPNGEQVPRSEWVTYNGDLMTVSPTPLYVISVEVLGAGHTFDGSIANVELVGK